MENALRYAQEGRRLDIAIAPRNGGYDITFRDKGPGVDDSFLPVMFERFSRADSSRARHSGGSGLGLSIARAICEAHGGGIHAAKQTHGGLMVTVSLPLPENSQ